MADETRDSFSYNDALILYSIRARHRGRTVADILDAEDMINRDRSTWEEMDLALRRFLALGLISQHNGRFYPTNLLLERYRGDKKQARYVHELVTQLQEQLNATMDMQAISNISLPGLVLDEAGYQRAVRIHSKAWKRSCTLLVILVIVPLLAGLIILFRRYPEVMAFIVGCILVAIYGKRPLRWRWWRR